MRVFDYSTVRGEDQPLQKLQAHMRGILKFGYTWENDLKAQEEIALHLGKGLDNRYVLLRNVTLPGLEIPIPLILIGPTGMAVINAKGEKGVFRAKGDSWSAINRRTRKFQPARENLITQTQLFAKVVDAYLTHNGQEHPEIQPALLFSHPGVHVDSSRPGVRVVLMDGMDRFTTSLAQARPVLTTSDIQKMVDALIEPASAKESRKEGQLSSSLAYPAAKLSEASRSLSEVDLPLPPVLKNLRFSTRQWVLLSVIAFFEVVILAFFILFLLLTA